MTQPYSEEKPSISLMKRENAPSYDAFFAALTFAPRIGIWRPQWNIAMRKQTYAADTPTGKEKFDKPMFGINWRNAFQLPKGILLNVDGMFSTKGAMRNEKYTRELFNLEVTAQKSFFKNRFSVQLFARDLFEMNTAQISMYSGIHVMDLKPDARRQFGMTLQYNFNNTKSKYKGKGAGESQKARM